MNSAAWNFASLPKTYSGLVALHMPRPIHDKVAYDNAVEVVHALAGHKLNPDQDDYLALMAKLVEDYESENVPEPKPVKAIEALKFLLEENSLTADDLGGGLSGSTAPSLTASSREPGTLPPIMSKNSLPVLP